MSEQTVFNLNELVFNVPYEQYAQSAGIRSSHLHNMMDSPAHYLVHLNETNEDSDALRFGRLVHSMIELGPDFIKTLFIEPEFWGKTKDGRESEQSAEAKQKRIAWHEELPLGAQAITQEEHESLCGMHERISEHGLLKLMLPGSKREASLWVKDQKTGLILKCRPDMIDNSGFLVDFKSSMSVKRKHVRRAVYDKDSYFYVFQLAFYTYCLKLAGVAVEEGATLFMLEKTKPWGIKTYSLGEGELDVGYQEVRLCLDKLAKCLETNQWPCYDFPAEQLGVPDWAKPPDDPYYEE